MEQPEEIVYKNLGLYERHVEFLENINKNTSLAARTVLDSVMRTNKKDKIKVAIDRGMLFIIIGLLFFVMAFMLTGIKVIIPTAIGAAALVYGLIELIGVLHGKIRRA